MRAYRRCSNKYSGERSSYQIGIETVRDTKSIEGFYPILIEFILLRDWTRKNVLHPFIWANFRNFHSIMNMKIKKERKCEGVSTRECVIYNHPEFRILQTVHNNFSFIFLHVLSQSLSLGLTNSIRSTLCIDNKYFILKISINT